MTFLALIVGVIFYYLWSTDNPVQQDGWYVRWQSTVQSSGLSGGLAVLLILFGPVLLAIWVLSVLDSILFGVFWIGAAAVLLIYAFGRRDYNTFVAKYQHFAKSGNLEAAYLTLKDSLPWLQEEEPPASSLELHAAVRGALSYEGYQRWFPVVFYFVIAGPAGALAYRLLHLLEDIDPGLKRRCLHVADWLPTRLTAATFAVAGDFSGSRAELVASLGDLDRPSADILTAVGRAANGAPDPDEKASAEIQSAEMADDVASLDALMSRSVGVWLVVISLFELLS
ncbi:MAG: regulatory signaling modulator protein AmpE [Halioglobus sp.]